MLKIPDDLVSFQRRSRAVSRILDGKSTISNLIRYFDANSDMIPQTFGPEVREASIDKAGIPWRKTPLVD
ncbi:hypothetical protein IVA86_00315 [Bradyrhizobium sp. 146]|uniref:hypothetical protein n=1 Tax=Bradyrhizobium sp. 146 TaxID=2782622 RepID=UPI001FF8CBE3|nr:hypothetical protein [Bradyrhizobium sp. 146]MCK1699922.1 hypothetical protein [Bradyrhizobium sp. 146]